MSLNLSPDFPRAQEVMDHIFPMMSEDAEEYIDESWDHHM